MIEGVELEVLRGRLDTLAEEMQLTLQRSAFSSVVKEGADASAALFDSRGELVAQANALPVHLGSIEPAVAALLRRYPPETLGEGDTLVTNDPYVGGQHLPDIVILSPVHWEGRVVAFTGSMAHHQDVGGMAPGSTPTNATELFQEGLRIPPLRLDGVVMDMIRANVRVPEVVEGDLRAQLAAASVGARRVRRLCAAYGADDLVDGLQRLLEVSETLTRGALASLPKGEYSFVDYLDNDGIDLERKIPIAVAVRLGGTGHIEFDFTGSSGQVRGPINAVPSVTLSAVRYVTRILAGNGVPNNAGCYRPIRLHLPAGSIVNPVLPAAVNCRAVTLRRIVDACLGALCQAVPERLSAANNGHPLMLSIGGRRDDGTRFVTSIVGTGGMGARPNKDGVSCVQTDTSNASSIPAESLEMDYPLRVHRSRLRDDSGGPGRFRGGLGWEFVLECLADEVWVSHRGERHFTSPWGVLGGAPGAPSVSFVRRAADGREERILSKGDFPMRRGDILYIYTTGGGGYGDPASRDAAALQRDVQEGRVSPASALSSYGRQVEGRWPTVRWNHD